MKVTKPNERKCDNRLCVLYCHDFSRPKETISSLFGQKYTGSAWIDDDCARAAVIRWVNESKTQSQSRRSSAWNEDDIVAHIAQQQVTRVCVCQLQHVFCMCSVLAYPSDAKFVFFSAHKKQRKRTESGSDDRKEISIWKREKILCTPFSICLITCDAFFCQRSAGDLSKRVFAFKLTNKCEVRNRKREFEGKKVSKWMKTHVDERQNEFHFDSYDVTRDTNRFVLNLHTFRVISCHTPECVVSNGRQSFRFEEIAFRCRWNVQANVKVNGKNEAKSHPNSINGSVDGMRCAPLL